MKIENRDSDQGAGMGCDDSVALFAKKGHHARKWACTVRDM
jgi:hypothetical protein